MTVAFQLWHHCSAVPNALLSTHSIDLRKESRRLENEIDMKLVSFSKLGSTYSHRDTSESSLGIGSSGHVFDTMALEIDQLLSKVSLLTRVLPGITCVICMIGKPPPLHVGWAVTIGYGYHCAKDFISNYMYMYSRFCTARQNAISLFTETIGSVLLIPSLLPRILLRLGNEETVPVRLMDCEDPEIYNWSWWPTSFYSQVCVFMCVRIPPASQCERSSQRVRIYHERHLPCNRPLPHPTETQRHPPGLYPGVQQNKGQSRGSHIKIWGGGGGGGGKWICDKRSFFCPAG